MESSINSKMKYTFSVLAKCSMMSVSMTLKANFNNKITQYDLCLCSLDPMAALLIDLFFSV